MVSFISLYLRHIKNANKDEHTTETDATDKPTMARALSAGIYSTDVTGKDEFDGLGIGRSTDRGVRVGDVVVLEFIAGALDVVRDVTVDVTIGAGVVVIVRGNSDDGTVLVCTQVVVATGVVVLL